MAKRQMKAWETLIDNSHRSNTREDLNNLSKAASVMPTSSKYIIEIGSGSCYNSKLIKSFLPKAQYVGVDISYESLSLNNDNSNFLLNCSADNLSISNQSIDVLIDGATIIHLPNWKEALKEYFRVTKNFIILHSITISDSSSFYFTKFAYGQRVFEQSFNLQEIENFINAHSWHIVQKLPGVNYNLELYFGYNYKSKSETWTLSR